MAGEKEGAAPERRLVIVVPGMNKQRARWEALRDALLTRGVFGNAELVDFHIFDHRIGPFSRRAMADAANGIEARIAAVFNEKAHRDVILIGHSAGGALVRQAWLDAVEAKPGGFATIAWGPRVTRIVLFAGLSRGVSSQRTFWGKLATRLVQALPGRFTAEDCVRGSAFLTNLRIRWIRTMAAPAGVRRPVVTLLRGTSDTMVEEEDNSDVTTFRNAIYLEVPDAGHGDLHHLDEDAELRLGLFARAFTEMPPGGTQTGPGESAGEQVLMIVHGIRDSTNGNWVQQTKDRIARERPGVVAVAPGYGYVSAWRFALPGSRKRYSRAFRDFYTEQLAQRPGARFGVICHSNGTYLLGRSLRDFSAMTFDRIALAGSVLPQSYGWDEMIQQKRVTAVRSDVGAGDWPVGLLCSALSGIGMRDIGTGGYAGFLGTAVQDVRYHRGGHGGMLTSGNIDSMLDFVLGTTTATAPTLQGDSRWFGYLSRAVRPLAPVVAILLIVGLVAGIVIAGLAGNWPAVAALLAMPILVYFILETL